MNLFFLEMFCGYFVRGLVKWFLGFYDFCVFFYFDIIWDFVWVRLYDYFFIDWMFFEGKNYIRFICKFYYLVLGLVGRWVEIMFVE